MDDQTFIRHLGLILNDDDDDLFFRMGLQRGRGKMAPKKGNDDDYTK